MKCGHVFEVELSGDQRIIDFARDSECPNCRHVPASAPVDLQKEQFHQIQEFRASPRPHLGRIEP
jgi:hypothetical protein